MADEELIRKAQPDELKKLGYAMIKGMPCRLSDVNQLPKATANGNRRVQIVGVHIFTGKKYDDTINCTAGFNGIDVPITSKESYTILDVDASSGFLSLVDDQGNTKEDASLSKSEDGEFDELSQECIRRFSKGEILRVTVLTIMGKDVILEVAKDAEAA
mmetsp:Transcript_25424/g.49784  ORF Transcript_25424/g.49784 Transcript_25424/m.49784 type:complete len:159 (-) Transcript_25424:102-578(-)|eukprot:CAMPEP_0172721318 /NCGR_PEP_ID=MMETSP1074-20121228/78831_1 /TAXON_ID=2916 /ORGANISM="Ceratium fusus, Strain PA161109" /LENGTH=158 /DNA_ID=CAMNT_0013547039 /DNA_START=34 /DNA_END=510 /DNA_ORIENTATION=-